MPSYLEDAFQISVVELLRWNGFGVVHMPNQLGRRDKASKLLLKLIRMGFTPGFPDLLVFDQIPGPSAPAGMGLLCLAECKRPPAILKSGARSQAKLAPSDTQTDVQRDLVARGVPVFNWRTLEHVEADMASLGFRLRGRSA